MDFTGSTPVSNTGYDIKELTDKGATYAKQRDRFGDMRRGWWLDGVYLGESAKQALRDLEGKG